MINLSRASAFLLVATSLAATGCVRYDVVPMPAWSDVSTLKESDAQVYRHLALDMRKGGLEGTPYRAGEVIRVEAPAALPGVLTVYVYTEDGLDGPLPILEVLAGDKRSMVMPSEYAFPGGPFPPVPAETTAEAEFPWRVVFFQPSRHQFRFRVFVDKAEPIELSVTMIPAPTTK